MYIKWDNDHFLVMLNMRTCRSSVVLRIPFKHALRKLGNDIGDAWRIPAVLAAERAFASRTTLLKIEKGDPGVAIGIYGTVLHVSLIADRLGDLVTPRTTLSAGS